MGAMAQHFLTNSHKKIEMVGMMWEQRIKEVVDDHVGREGTETVRLEGRGYGMGLKT